MGANQDALMMVKAQMSRRIDMIAAAKNGKSPHAILNQLEEMRHQAMAHDMITLAGLAGQLERALCGKQGCVTISSYISAMHDALGCDDADPSTAAALYASVGQRLYG
jgi:hypothetical protein